MYSPKNLPEKAVSKSGAASSNGRGSVVPAIQCKLTIGAANDPLEHEADRMADRVVHSTSPASFLQTKCSNCHQENDQVNTKLVSAAPAANANLNGGDTVSDAISQKLVGNRDSGSAMPADTRSFMESKFQTDFSGVRIHTSEPAVQLSQHLNAQAFTVGNHIYFNQGKFAPSSTQGQHLLAHELTHTIQQGAAPIALQKEENTDKTYAPKPEIDFKLLPPDLQIRLFHFLVQADTSKVHLDFETRNFMAGLSYSYGDALSLKMRFSDFTTKLGWKPTFI